MDQQSTDRYRSLFVEHPHAVLGVDAGRRVIEANPAAGRIVGRELSDLIGLDVLDLVEPVDHDRLLGAFRDVLGRRPQRMELSLRRADGTSAEVEVTGVPWVGGDGVRGVFGIVEDVTGRNRTARELDAARDVAVEASRAKADFVARMSHDVRTPLTSILTTIELLARTGTTEEQEELVATLQRAAGRLLSLVDSVLDFASSAAAEPSRTSEFDLHAAVRDAVALAEKPARRKGIELTLDLGDDVPRRVRDHPTWTSRILDNLLDNAVRNTDRGGVHLAVSAATTEQATPGILYRVSDTGVGIDPAHHERIFDPFTRVGLGADQGSGHRGLGLSIVRQLVTISGRSIAVDSAPGRGATFFVLMPAQAAGPAA